MNFFALFANSIRTRDQEIFLQSTDGTTLSYQQLGNVVAALADRFVTLRVAAGDRILVKAPKSPTVICVYLACLKIGAVFVPVNPDATADETDHFIAEAEPSLIICDPRSAEACCARIGQQRVKTLGPEGTGSLTDGIDLQGAASTPDVEARELPDDAPAAILFTSGTTGKPKGAVLSHENLRSNALALVKQWGFQSSDTLIHALPIFHTHGLFVATHCVLVSGARMVFLPKFDIDQIMAHLPAATVLMGVPTFYNRLLQQDDFDRAKAGNIRLFISGSAPLPAEVFLSFEKRTGHRVLERYGMTETNMICSNPLEGQRVPGSVGKPLEGVTVRICRPDGELAKVNEVGSIQVKGPNVFNGYWKRPDRRQEDFTADGFFITGDMGSWDEQGYLTISGRSKELIISGGFNVYPKEIENEILKIGGIADAAVFGIPHQDFGEAVIAAIVLDPAGPDAPSADKIKTVLKERLSSYKLPKAIVFIDALPRNAMGKVQRNVLQKTYDAILTGK
jgi:malonyl-CoA/methylmalonyl-CoA synthetase